MVQSGAPLGPRTAEHERLAATQPPETDLFSASEWYEWGPYLAERAWGTVREDYSAGGDAWASFPHDHARSRAYRWNEDGLAGISDVRQRLCLALALWNGEDPILKERIFGLTGPEGNHGEDAKEYWWYLDALPSHAWLRWRYHYPQARFPYEDLVEENGRRGFGDPEYELLDTGAFDDDRYWSVEVTYAKAGATDVLARIEVTNHGPEAAPLHVLPTLWFRNTWSWDGDPADDEPDGPDGPDGPDAGRDRPSVPRPRLHRDGGAIVAEHPTLGAYELLAATGPDGAPRALFCENETNAPRVFGTAATTPYPKDGINDHVVTGAATVAPDEVGTKAAWWYRLDVPAGGRAELRLRLRAVDRRSPTPPDWAGAAFDEVLAARAGEADEFHASLLPDGTDAEAARIVREAAAGLVWTKQYYPYRVARWLDGDPGQPPPPAARADGRNARWRHLDADDVLAMPDAWEYPWFAAWDLAFHAIPWAHLDPAFAKYQLLVLLREWFLHPNGALPAYEWSFDDVNPPVHAFAALRVFHIDGDRDIEFIERSFQKLLLNFMWWVNHFDDDGDNLFGGGFLGLDNISPIDRSHLPAGARLEQADGSAWVAFNTLNLLAMAVRLADHDDVYDDLVVTFFERFVAVTRAINRAGIYDPERGFFYDRMVTPSGTAPVEVETIGGAVPLFSAATLAGRLADRDPGLARRLARAFAADGADPDELLTMGRARLGDDGDTEATLISIAGPDQLRRTLAVLFDEDAFLSPHGLRSLSRRFAANPYVVQVDGERYEVDYEPAESTTPMYGGNSNWRGPVWFPMNYLVIRSLVRFHDFFGEGFTVEYPTGSGRELPLRAIAQDLADRLVSTFRRGPDGRRPVFGGVERLQHDPAWDHLLFFEYFHGDDGAGLGASHQTGWTALVLDLLVDPPATTRPVTLLPFGLEG